MTWPIEHFHYIPGPSSFIEMMPGAMKAMTQCAGVKEGENVVIACDTNKMRLAEALAAAAAGGVPTIVAFPPTGAHGRQVPKAVVGACARCDVFFLPTSWSMTHTDARIEDHRKHQPARSSHRPGVGRDGGAPGRKGLQRLRAQVIYHHLVPCFQQVAGHAEPHVPGSDKPHLRRHRSTFYPAASAPLPVIQCRRSSCELSASRRFSSVMDKQLEISLYPRMNVSA